MPQEKEIKIKSKILENRLAIVFLILFIASSLGWIRERKYSMPRNHYELIDPARELIPQENYIINIQSLRDYLTSIGEREGNNISIYYEQLNSGANISINKDQRFYLASLVKLPTAMMAMKKVETGEWSMDRSFLVDPSEIDAGSGDLYKKGAGNYTLDELLKALIIDSDNTAQNVLNKNFKPENFEEIVNEIGLEDLFDSEFKGSAKEYTRLLRALYTSSYLKRTSSQNILELMSQSKFKKFLSNGVPDNVKFAHKYGENTEHHIFADSGIVYVPGKPYMLTVIYQGKDGTIETENKATELMKDISTHAYQAGIISK